MKSEKANVNATLYDGEFQIGFDCAGAETCRFALCSTMPPDGDEECFFRQNGSCTHRPSQQAAIESFRNRITKELKTYGEVEV